MRTMIASDWHLGSFSTPMAAELARLFLERARAAGDRVVLNGDIFEGLFQPVQEAEAAHPVVQGIITEMTARGQLVRIAGNHDPDAGSLMMVLDHPSLGRVLIAHGHAADPLHQSSLGQLGDAISRRMGRAAIVRNAARFAECAANRLAGAAMEHTFRARCRSLVCREECALGVFGHIHRQYCATGDRYANAGHLEDRRLEYLVLADGGARLAYLEPDESRSMPRWV
jgi:UDP-2,3-diacylglucosamine pyrophosphatase LpxH